MRELKLTHLANVTSKTLKTGAVHWSVTLSAEGLMTKTRVLQGESSPILSGRDLQVLVSMSLNAYGCSMRHCFRPVGPCDKRTPTESTTNFPFVSDLSASLNTFFLILHNRPLTGILCTLLIS